MKWATSLLCLVLLAPLALTDVPPLLDYPNHLARAVVLAAGTSDPVLSRMYVVHWAIIPNLGTDLVLPALLHILPAHVAGRVVVGMCLLLPVLGTLAYSRAVFGVWAAWPLASGLVAYNATFLLGFLNFVAGIGIALLLAAAWILWRDRRPVSTIALAMCGTVGLFFCHLMGLLLFCVLIAGFELERIWSRRAQASAVVARLVATLPLALPPVVLYGLSPLAPLDTAIEFSPPLTKLGQLVLPFANYILPLDIVTATAVAAFLLACAVTRHCRITPAGGLTLGLTLLLFLAAPWALKGTYFLDTRFVIMLGFLLFAAVLPVGLPREAALFAGMGFAALFAIRVGVIGEAWHQHAHDLADLRAVIAQVPPGAKIMVAAVTLEDAPEYWRSAPFSRRLSAFGLRLDVHAAALLLIEHRAYWPFLFDNPSQQPVATHPPYRQLAERADAITRYRQLAAPDSSALCGFDGLLLLDAGGAPDLETSARGQLRLVRKSDFAALFLAEAQACIR
jgi:hypothetical protein